MFAEMIGKESVLKESISTSGSRYSTALNNLNESSQEVARDLINPDELMKLPPTEALILNQGMPPYIAKKVVYYMDSRFKDKAYSAKKIKRFDIAAQTAAAGETTHSRQFGLDLSAMLGEEDAALSFDAFVDASAAVGSDWGKRPNAKSGVRHSCATLFTRK